MFERFFLSIRHLIKINYFQSMRFLLIFFFSFIYIISFSQNKKLQNGIWRATVERDDLIEIVFNIEVKQIKNKQHLFIKNDIESIEVKDLKINKDSVIFSMPTFESYFKARILQNGSLQGIWFKDLATSTQLWKFVAIPNTKLKFKPNLHPVAKNISGRWEITFYREDGSPRPALAEFTQSSEKLVGTFLTPSGDYRYLNGIIRNDSIFISTFDGSHAFYLTAKIENNNTISNGLFYSGKAGIQKWIGKRNKDYVLPDMGAAPQLKDDETSLNFRFKSTEGELISIKDDKFKNKVTIIQIMGSWCPNCMDETQFLNNFYSSNKNKGIEVIALAYEYTTDFERSKKSIAKFQNKFNVQYPILITGVAVSDELKTEKTLPQITPIKVFPTTIFIDKKGIVRKIKAGFYGPSSGEHHENFKKEFNNIVNNLLYEN